MVFHSDITHTDLFRRQHGFVMKVDNEQTSTILLLIVLSSVVNVTPHNHDCSVFSCWYQLVLGQERVRDRGGDNQYLCQSKYGTEKEFMWKKKRHSRDGLKSRTKGELTRNVVGQLGKGYGGGSQRKILRLHQCNERFNFQESDRKVTDLFQI